jgi:hypothetical protein
VPAGFHRASDRKSRAAPSAAALSDFGIQAFTQTRAERANIRQQKDRGLRILLENFAAGSVCSPTSLTSISGVFI